jgi:flagellar motor protein MotB
MWIDRDRDPCMPEPSEEEREKNRRVEFLILDQK